MNLNYKIIDNFLPKENFNKIKEIIFGCDFNWFYSPGINYPNEDPYNLFYFTHLFYNKNIPNSPFFNLIIENLVSHMDDVHSLIRMKANLYPNQGIKRENGKHVDNVFPHKGAIFYINTNNGRTILNNKIKIDSVENRILYFDPQIPHDSENCTDQKVRVNININYF
tara:strand:+ start:82 stop:582 length:501 start_codon:yes stop_codon:yes gene_type:complete